MGAAGSWRGMSARGSGMDWPNQARMLALERRRAVPLAMYSAREGERWPGGQGCDTTHHTCDHHEAREA